MASIEPSDYRDRRDRESRDRDREETRSPSSSSGTGSLYRQSSKNTRMSNIESSVTRLLVATKQLIETLTAWSRRQATETEVSDVYVRLGNEFNVARSCFERAGIEMSDLSDIPTQLRQVLETCLARDASPRVLEIYLPKVREIVINLLQGLKRKQARYRARSQVSEDDSRFPRSQPQPPPEVNEPPPQTPRRKESPARRPVGGREPSSDRKSQPREPPQPPDPNSAQPPPEPVTNEALQKLQSSDALQRRASKRFSAYNFAKLDGYDPETGQRNIPPVPSRRSGSYSPELTRSPRPGTKSPRRRSPERRPETTLPEKEDSRPSSSVPSREPVPVPGGMLTSPEKMPVFLQLGSLVRKTLVSSNDLTLQSIRLLFVEKFQFNPGAETFPDIHITDRETGVRYILEDGVQDITEGTMLTLDVEDSTMKKTFNDGMAVLLKEIANLQQTVASQQDLLLRLTEQNSLLKEELISQRDETLRKLESISFSKLPPSLSSSRDSPALKAQLTALKALKRDLTTLRSEHSAFQSQFTTSLTSFRNIPFSTAIQVVTGDDLASQKSDLESKTQTLVTLSDDLSDQVDDLRIDITQKRVRPHPRTVSNVRKQSSTAKAQLEALESLLRTIKPVWKRKWEDELQQVIDGQEFLRHQETLVVDLRKDLSDTETVVAQIIQAAELFEASTPREWLAGAVGSGGRDALLGEVKTLQPNSAERIEAIKRAEKARARELELRRETEFQLELGEVVTVGKMKMHGQGALRIEREREEKEKQIRKEIWERERERERNRSLERNLNGDEPGVKRTLSEGSSGLAGAKELEEGVARSQSYSGLGKRVSSPLKRASGESEMGNEGEEDIG